MTAWSRTATAIVVLAVTAAAGVATFAQGRRNRRPQLQVEVQACEGRFLLATVRDAIAQPEPGRGRRETEQNRDRPVDA